MFIRIVNDEIVDVSYENEGEGWIDILEVDIDTDKGMSVLEHTDIIPESFWLQRVESQKELLHGRINIDVVSLGRKYNFNKTTRELFVSNFSIRCVAIDSTFPWDDFENNEYPLNKLAAMAILEVAESYMQAVYQASKLDKRLIRDAVDYSMPNLSAIPDWWALPT